MQTATTAPKAAFREQEASRPAPFWFKAMAAILVVNLSLSLVMLALIAIRPTVSDTLPERLVDLKAQLLGQPAAQMMAHACVVIFSQPERAERAYQCHLDISGEAITVVSSAGVIEALIIPVNAVRLGDLIMSWGRPDQVDFENAVYRARWHNGFSVAFSVERRVGYLYPVEVITVQRQP